MVTPCEGVGVEIIGLWKVLGVVSVTPCEGGGVEKLTKINLKMGTSHALRGRGSRNAYENELYYGD